MFISIEITIFCNFLLDKFTQIQNIGSYVKVKMNDTNICKVAALF